LNVAIRVDSSASIGLGHLSRTLNIALELRDRGARVYFICRDFQSGGAKLAEAAGFDVFALPRPKAPLAKIDPTLEYAAWLGVSLEEEIAESKEALKKIGFVDWLLIDSYALDRRYESAMSGFCRKIAVLDDLADRPHAAHLLIDGAFAREKTAYESLVSKKTKLLCGADYLPLRSDFARYRSLALPRRFPPREILTSMGGSDAKNLTGEALKAIAQSPFSGAIVRVVLSSLAPNIAQNVKLARKLRLNVDWRIDAKDMPLLVLRADLAVGALGVSAYERACLALASVTVLAAENQRENLARLGAARAIIGEGTILEALNGLNEERIRSCERAAFAVCDALGTKRICRELEKGAAKSAALR
jgi:UDP-2,4-diacetamido-2,4,6-trideoxy-beta-L-altropyranose hydrolase